MNSARNNPRPASAPSWNRRCFLGGALAAGMAATARTSRAEPGSETAAPLSEEPKGVLVFDVFGTVVDWRSGLAVAAEDFGRRSRVAVDGPALADAWAKAYGAAVARVNRGDRPWAKLESLLRESLDELLSAFGFKAPSAADRAHLVRAWRRLPPWPDSVEGLRRLRRRHWIAPLSNANVSLLVDMARFSGLPWDAILSAELVRRYKPDPAVYRLVPELLDVAPSDVTLVAAHAYDLEAAAACGLKTAYVHRPLERGPRGSPQRPAARTFDIDAADFLDLARQLDAG